MFVTGAGLLSYAAYVVVTWLRYGRARTSDDREPTIARFIPAPEVDELHETRVAAPASVTFAAACELDLRASPIVRAIFALRALPSRLRGNRGSTSPSRGWVAESEALGWGRLAQHAGHELIMGAITQPWKGEPEFQALPREEFAAFDEPGYAKIAWTIEAEPTSDNESVVRTRTRVVTTDADSRRRFRRYWTLLSPGILAIRWEALRTVKASAERRARERTRVAEPATASGSEKPSVNATHVGAGIRGSGVGRDRSYDRVAPIADALDPTTVSASARDAALEIP